MNYTVMNAADRGTAGLMLLPEEAKAMGAPPVLGRLHLRQGRRRSGRRPRESRRQGASPALRHPRRRPFRGRRRPARGDVHADVAERTRPAARTRRNARPHRLARALRKRLEERLRLLCRAVRLDQGRGDGHGRDGHLPAARRRDRRHDGQARRLPRAVLALLLQRARRSTPPRPPSPRKAARS